MDRGQLRATARLSLTDMMLANGKEERTQQTRGVQLSYTFLKGDTRFSVVSVALTSTPSSGQRGNVTGWGAAGGGTFWGITCPVLDQAVVTQLCSLGDGSLSLRFGFTSFSALVGFFN